MAAGRWTETGEMFLEEDVIEWIVKLRIDYYQDKELYRSGTVQPRISAFVFMCEYS